MDNSHIRSVTAWLWISQLQYFLAQIIVAKAWSIPYSWQNNYISDLGNTACGLYATQFVCSPLHALMNASFIVLGTTMAVGAWFLGRLIKAASIIRVGINFLIAAGIGTVFVGLYPENTVPVIHVVAASLPFVFGNLALILLGFGIPNMPKWLRIFSVAAGVLALSALGLLLLSIFIGIGKGNVERIISYLQTIWMIITGVWLLRSSWVTPR